MAKWKPKIAQFEFTQMAQYAADCAPARTILVEHDITYDLYQQMLIREEDWENRRQYERWLRFETAAWRSVDRVVVMSDKDREAIPESVDYSQRSRSRPVSTLGASLRSAASALHRLLRPPAQRTGDGIFPARGFSAAPGCDAACDRGSEA